MSESLWTSLFWLLRVTGQRGSRGGSPGGEDEVGEGGRPSWKPNRTTGWAAPQGSPQAVRSTPGWPGHPTGLWVTHDPGAPLPCARRGIGGGVGMQVSPARPLGWASEAGHPVEVASGGVSGPRTLTRARHGPGLFGRGYF